MLDYSNNQYEIRKQRGSPAEVLLLVMGCSRDVGAELVGECSSWEVRYDFISIELHSNSVGITHAHPMGLMHLSGVPSDGTQLFKSFEFGNESRISDENLVILEFKYLRKKKS